MAFAKNRPVNGSVLYDDDGNLIGVFLDGSIYRLETRTRLSDGTLDNDLVTDENGVNRVQVQGFGESRVESVVVADYYKAAIPGTAVLDLLAIDLDNNADAGPYKHDYTGTGIKLRGLSAQIVKETVKDPWNVKFGVITAITASDADITWFQIGALHATDSSRATERFDPGIFPLELDMTSTLAKVAAGQKSVGDTTIHTAMTLVDVGGNSVTPAVGDIVLRVTPEGLSNDTAIINYAFWYVAE